MTLPPSTAEGSTGLDFLDSADIAIVGLAGRFPGARNVEEFWANIAAGVESISVFAEEELTSRGVDTHLRTAPNYVPAGGVLADADTFDAAFFGISPREAALIDPQHRLFLESCWEALENAGYDVSRISEPVGVFGGMGTSAHLIDALTHPELLGEADPLQLILGNDKDYLCTRVSYKLNLTGPSVSVQTACSTSLVAVHLACQSLLTYGCDIALAGGVSISVNHGRGYLYQEGELLPQMGTAAHSMRPPLARWAAVVLAWWCSNASPTRS